MKLEKLGNINLYKGDCMDYMATCKDNEFDLAIVDVNYGIKEDGRKTAGRTFRKDGSARRSIDKRSGRSSVIFNTYESKRWDESQPEQSYFDELFRISINQIIFGENYLKFNQKNKSTGRLFWDKVNFDNDFSDGELIWTNLFPSVRQIRYMWNGMLQGKSIKEGYLNQGNKKLCEKRIHPTQKPVKLYGYLIMEYAKSGQKIFDSHFGSLSIGIACHNLGYELTACEKDKDYYEDAKKRLKIHQMQQKLF